jgi:hypothetical protein
MNFNEFMVIHDRDISYIERDKSLTGLFYGGERD